MNVPEGKRHFFTGPVIKTELLIVWLEKHGIEASQEWAEAATTDAVGSDAVEDFDRHAHVFVEETGYDRAYQLFFAEREDEL